MPPNCCIPDDFKPAWNSLSNHLINVEEELKWLQDQITSGSWNIDIDKFLELFSSDDAENNETLAEEIAGENVATTIKTEPVDKHTWSRNSDDANNNKTVAEEIAGENIATTIKTEPFYIVGNELVQFNHSMLDFDTEIGNSNFLQCLGQDAEVPVDILNNMVESKDFADIIDQTDELAASEAAGYLLNKGSSSKQKAVRRPRVQKSQKAKRQKIK